MARTLHTNIRNYREPFYLIKNEIEKLNGIDTVVGYKQILMFGSIRNVLASQTETQNSRMVSSITIKIIKPNIDILAGDNIKYRNNNYVITSIDWDLYSYNEMILRCEFQTPMNPGEPFVQD